MADIKITKHNELHVHIEANQYIWYELRDLFAFRPDGYKFTPSFKRGMWDGYIRLVDLRSSLLYQGLLPELFIWAKENGYTIEIDKSYGDFIHSFGGVAEYLDNWADWCIFEPHEYQLYAIEQALKINKGLILSPTGSGKSLICYGLVNYLMTHTKHRVLITVPTTQLVEQLTNDFASYQPKGYDITNEVHKVYGGKEKFSDKRITISTWQSMIKMPPEYFSQFDAYICDEAHQADGKSISDIINKVAATGQIRIGMTGTLDGTKCHMMQLKGLFGPIIKTKTTKELMDAGMLSSLKVEVRILRYANKVDKAHTEQYQAEIDYITTHEERVKYVVDTVMGLDHNTLVLFNFVDKHGKVLYNKALEVAKENGKEVFYISGETSVQDREVIRQKFSTQSNVILFASHGTFSAGINAPNIHYLVLSHPGKARIRTLQSIGRALRNAAGKTVATLIDLADDLFPDKKPHLKNHSYNHLLKRLEIYEAEQFDYIVKTVDFKN